MNRLREKFQRFMIGRHGVDQLGQFMIWAILVLIVINLFVRASLPSAILGTLELMGLITVCFRMFSKNVGKCYQENQMSLRMRFYATGYWRKVELSLTQGRKYRIPKYPNCSQKTRIPGGYGKISIYCPKCETDFIRKT